MTKPSSNTATNQVNKQNSQSPFEILLSEQLRKSQEHQRQVILEKNKKYNRTSRKKLSKKKQNNESTTNQETRKRDFSEIETDDIFESKRESEEQRISKKERKIRISKKIVISAENESTDQNLSNLDNEMESYQESSGLNEESLREMDNERNSESNQDFYDQSDHQFEDEEIEDEDLIDNGPSESTLIDSIDEELDDILSELENREYQQDIQNAIDNLIPIQQNHIQMLIEKAELTPKEQKKLPLAYIQRYDEKKIKPYTCGNFVERCSKCSAVFFKGERKRSTDGSFSICCSNGKVQLPENPECPELIKTLLNPDHPLHDNFVTNIRSYNNSSSFASFGANFQHFDGPSSLTIKGSTYHLLSNVETSDGEKGYIQTYCMDPKDAIEVRLNNQHNSHCDREIFRLIQEMMEEINPIARKCYTMYEKIQKDKLELDRINEARERSDLPKLEKANDNSWRFVFYKDKTKDRRVYNKPTSDEEIGFVIANNQYSRGKNLDKDIVIYQKTNSSSCFTEKRTISFLSERMDSLCYVLLFPRGELGFTTGIKLKYIEENEIDTGNLGITNNQMQMEQENTHIEQNDTIANDNNEEETLIQQCIDQMEMSENENDESEEGETSSSKRKHVTLAQYKSYILQIRKSTNEQGEIIPNLYYTGEEDKSYLLDMYRLTQQCILDSFLQIELNKLNFLRENQEKLKISTLETVQETLHRKAEGENVDAGKDIILASSYQRGHHFMSQRCSDCMAMFAQDGVPDLFITVTANPQWDDYKRLLQQFYGEKNDHSINDRPDILVRVFQMVLNSILNDIQNKKIFGKVKCRCHCIEFQKRGLPHAHILVKFEDDYAIDTVEKIDSIISAEIPDKNKNPELFQKVTKFMMHGPCGNHNKNCSCMNDDKTMCTKRFPKTFESETVLTTGFPRYRRREKRRN